MPQVQDSQVALTGTIIAIEFTRNFETKQQDGGAKITVIAGDGLSIVKVSPEAMQAITPVINDRIAWMIRNTPWSMEGQRSGMSSSLVRLVDLADVDLLHSAVTDSAAAKAGK